MRLRSMSFALSAMMASVLVAAPVSAGESPAPSSAACPSVPAGDSDAGCDADAVAEDDGVSEGESEAGGGPSFHHAAELVSEQEDIDAEDGGLGAPTLDQVTEQVLATWTRFEPELAMLPGIQPCEGLFTRGQLEERLRGMGPEPYPEDLDAWYLRAQVAALLAGKLLVVRDSTEDGAIRDALLHDADTLMEFALGTMAEADGTGADEFREDVRGVFEEGVGEDEGESEADGEGDSGIEEGLPNCGTSPDPSLTASASPAALPAGTIEGDYVEQRQDGSDSVAPAGVEIGLYAEPFLPGTDRPNSPPPLATTVTGEGGRFSFSGVEPGDWFLTTIGAPVFSEGTMVALTETEGASVLLIGCTDCPAPN